MNVVILGADGFIGKNLAVSFRQEAGVELRTYDVGNNPGDLDHFLRQADVICHLAGANRPDNPEDFERVNYGFTRDLCAKLLDLDKAPKILFASSVQAALDNPYGRSKKRAEEELSRFASVSGSTIVVFRLKNVFGKWCRPDYNSVVATFCHHILFDLPIHVSDADRRLELVYVDDVVRGFVAQARNSEPGFRYVEASPTFQITLGQLAETIQAFKRIRAESFVPDFGDPLIRRLHAVYLSYLEPKEFAYPLISKKDARGTLTEILKSDSFGQIFVSTTAPGITRGNHYHHTKTEKFIVLRGKAIINFRHILGGEVISHSVSGQEIRVVDIPPGYTHNIKNIGDTEMILLIWASEPFNPDAPDTYSLEVEHE